LTVGDPTDSVGLELEVIAAVVIGGGSLSGGQGSVPGALIGALLLTVIKTGCTHVGLPNWVQEILTGGIIVLAMGIDKLRHRKD
jgi:ribose/xylose/arabinose/galactoside ABC-type transport system permease subunit